MSDKKITELATGTPTDSDWIPYVDIADTSMAPSGTTKKSHRSLLLGPTGYTGYTGAPGPTSGLASIGARVYNTSDQTITTGTDTVLNFNTTVFDTDSMHNNSVNNSRLTINTSGKYLVTASVHWNPSVTTSLLTEFRVNGTTISGYIADRSHADSAFVTQNGSILINLTAGDYVELVVNHNRGFDLNVVNGSGGINTWFSAIRQADTGYTGYTGYTGAAGTVTGYTGYTGYTGSAGAAASTGATGYTGYTGYTGASGAASSTGATGYTGYTGPTVTFIGAKVYTTPSNQTITTGTDTVLTFNTEFFDTDTMHDNVTNNSRLTINTAGYYLITGDVHWNSSSGVTKTVWIYKNGNAVAYVQSRNPADSSNFDTQNISTVLSLTGGDYVELAVTHNRGFDLDVVNGAGGINTWFSAVMLH